MGLSSLHRSRLAAAGALSRHPVVGGGPLLTNVTHFWGLRRCTEVALPLRGSTFNECYTLLGPSSLHRSRLAAAEGGSTFNECYTLLGPSSLHRSRLAVSSGGGPLLTNVTHFWGLRRCTEVALPLRGSTFNECYTLLGPSSLHRSRLAAAEGGVHF